MEEGWEEQVGGLAVLLLRGLASEQGGVGQVAGIRRGPDCRQKAGRWRSQIPSKAGAKMSSAGEGMWREEHQPGSSEPWGNEERPVGGRGMV